MRVVVWCATLGVWLAAFGPAPSALAQPNPATSATVQVRVFEGVG